MTLSEAGGITRIQLTNGITVLVRENHDSPAVVVSGYLWAGALSEAPEQAGLASFTAGMLMRGTETRTFGQINEALESTGAQLGFRAGVHTAGFGGKSLAQDLGLLLTILADSLQAPTFPAGEMEKLRGQILTGLQRRAFDTRSMAGLTFDSLLYPDHPYGRAASGYEETVSALGRDDLLGHYQGHYSPQGMVIAIVGAVEVEYAVEEVRKALGGWSAPDAAPNRDVPPAVQLSETRHQTCIIEGKTQSDIVIGWPALARNDPDWMAANLANTVLGVFGMMGRLGDRVREELGLAYYAYSRLNAGIGAGPWTAVAGVNPANVELATDGILGEVRRLCDEPVPASELADSQAFLTGSMPLRLETNEGVAANILNMERYGLGLDYLQRYAGLVNAVTVDDVQRVAQKYLDPGIYALAVAGPEPS